MATAVENPIYPSDLVKAIQDSVVPPTVTVGDEVFTTTKLTRVPDVEWQPLGMTTLKGFIDYVKLINEGREPSLSINSMLIHVRDFDLVHLVTSLGSTRDRRTIATALYGSPIDFSSMSDYKGLSLETAIIYLQTYFCRPNSTGDDDVNNLDGDISALIKYLGNVEFKAIETSTDDGVSQATQVKTGFGKLENQVLPSPCNLRAFRTFVEIEQPLLPWVVRMSRSGDEVRVKLMECDGGMWKAETIQKIKAYLESELQGISIPIVA